MKLYFFAEKVLESRQIPQTSLDNNKLRDILLYVFLVMGAVSVLLLVIAAIRYMLAMGTPDKMAGARRMIIYTLIGLAVSAMSVAIVNLMLGEID